MASHPLPNLPISPNQPHLPLQTESKFFEEATDMMPHKALPTNSAQTMASASHTPVLPKKGKKAQKDAGNVVLSIPRSIRLSPAPVTSSTAYAPARCRSATPISPHYPYLLANSSTPPRTLRAPPPSPLLRSSYDSMHARSASADDSPHRSKTKLKDKKLKPQEALFMPALLHLPPAVNSKERNTFNELRNERKPVLEVQEREKNQKLKEKEIEKENDNKEERQKEEEEEEDKAMQNGMVLEVSSE